MQTPETKARGRTDLSAPPSPMTDVKSALTGFLSDFNEFQADISAKLQQQEERLTMLDRKTTTAVSRARPALSTAAETEAPHQKAFAAYLRTGDDDGLRGLELEGKSLGTAVAADGGYLVDPQTSATIKGVLSTSASLRAVATVVNVDATSYDVLVDHEEFGTGWATESAGVTETATPKIDRISIPLHELSALPKASQRLLDDSGFDIENWLAMRIADRFSRAEAAAFITGDGVDKPRGFLDHVIVSNSNWEWGKLGHVKSGAAGAFGGVNPVDAIVNLVYNLGAEYRANATFVMNSKTTAEVRKLKDADGRFLWTDGIAQGEPARLLGYPVLVAEDMPDIATDSYSIAFGDFAVGYTVAERAELRILRDPFSAKPHVLFYATKRIGGDVTDFAAIKVLKFAA